MGVGWGGGVCNCMALAMYCQAVHQWTLEEQYERIHCQTPFENSPEADQGVDHVDLGPTAAESCPLAWTS